MKAYLCLQDGKIFPGKSIGFAGEAAGEVVFNTSMTGYQEIITDPTCAGQIIVFTYPLIGNCGVNFTDAQSAGAKIKGLVMRELSDYPSNYRAEENLHSYLVSQGVVGIKDIDTRALTKHLRRCGTMRGLISIEDNLTELAKRAKELPLVNGFQLVQSVTVKKTQTFPGGQYPVTIMDFGTKKAVIDMLRTMDCQVTLVRAETKVEEILATQPWGVLLSNGPGDPCDAVYALPVINKLLESGIPVMGIGMGHLLLGMALGGSVYRLKYGHRGPHPVKEVAANRIYITSQNHGYVLNGDSFSGDDVLITHLNLHDQTVEGLRHQPTGAFSVQFNPEACPGPRETADLFVRFIARVKEFGEKRGEQDA